MGAILLDIFFAIFIGVPVVILGFWVGKTIQGIDALAYSYKDHWRIITDIEIPFPKNYELVKHDPNIEVSNVRWDEHPKQGWGKPDKIFGGVEVRYLWKSFVGNY